MPASIERYFRSPLNLIGECRIARANSLTLDTRTPSAGFIRGDLYFSDNSRLHLRETVELGHQVVRLMYSYHYQRADGSLVFRYDDTPHHPGLATFPHHKHVETEAYVVPATAPALADVLHEIEDLYSVDESQDRL